MTTKTENPNRPTHAIWHVYGEGDNARWTRIGSAWLHKDKKGANMMLDLAPLTGRTVIREVGQKEAQAAEGGAQ